MERWKQDLKIKVTYSYIIQVQFRIYNTLLFQNKTKKLAMVAIPFNPSTVEAGKPMRV